MSSKYYWRKAVCDLGIWQRC